MIAGSKLRLTMMDAVRIQVGAIIGYFGIRYSL